jgi:hypothetical protein
MTKSGGMIFGYNANHLMTPCEYERIKDFGLTFNKSNYEDGEKATF